MLMSSTEGYQQEGKSVQREIPPPPGPLVVWPLQLTGHHTRPCKLLYHCADGRVYMQNRIRLAVHAGSFRREAPTPDGGFQYNDTPWGDTLLFFTETISTKKLIVLLLTKKKKWKLFF